MAQTPPPNLPQWLFFKKYQITAPREMETVALDLQKLFKERTLLLLEGVVGAGKTELVKALSRALGITEIASPSYAIHHHYEDPTRNLRVDHVDLYRLENDDDLESTGFWDLFSAPRGLVMIEWADRLNEHQLPLNWFQIKVQIEQGLKPKDRVVSIFILAKK